MTNPILYSFRRCPYAMRARMALRVSGQVCELREVVLRDKPPELLAISAKGTVPVLVDAEGQVIAESLEIMFWALHRHDPQGWLTPERGNLAAMLTWIAPWDDQFKYHLDRYKYAYRYPGAEAQTHRQQASRYLEQLNAQLQQTRYVFGDGMSLADAAIAPFVRQFAHVDRHWFNAQPWPQVQHWLAAILESDIFSQIMEKYPQWHSGTTGPLFPPPYPLAQASQLKEPLNEW